MVQLTLAGIHHDVLNLASASARPFLKPCTFSENCSPDWKAGSLIIMSESRAVFALNMQLSFIRLCIDFAWL